MFCLNRYARVFPIALFTLLYLPFSSVAESVGKCIDQHCTVTKPLSKSPSLAGCRGKISETELLIAKNGLLSLEEKSSTIRNNHVPKRCNLGLDDVEHSSALDVFAGEDYCISHSPRDQATDVSVGTLIAVSPGLDSPLWAAFVDDSVVLKSNDSIVSTTVCQDNGLIILKPDSVLDPFSLYTVIISPHVVESAEQKEISYSWSFTTAGYSLPLLGLWEENMVKYGEKWGRYLESYYPKPLSYSESKGIYYDAQRVYLQIARYTGESEPWVGYAKEAERIHRTYLDSRGWITQGWRKFPHGFYLDWLRTRSESDREALLALRDNKVFHNPEASREAWYWSHRSREIAFALEANVFAERAGYARNTLRVPLYIDMVLNHINEWVTGERGNPDTSKHRFSPFMAGLTAEALIDFYEWEVERGANPDSEIPDALAALADFLWTSKVVHGPDAGKRMWVGDVGGKGPRWTDEGGSGYGAFRYEDQERSKNSTKPAPNLNLLIAPLYAWLYKYYGDSTYIKKGDLIWEGGVALANVGWNTKIFNQNYRWSFDYVKWRNEGDEKMRAVH